MNRIRIERGAGAGEPVHVWPAQEDAAPSEFVWRGRRYRVRALETAMGERSAPSSRWRRFRVRTTDGLACLLSHDVARGAWRMDRLIPSGGGR